MKPPGLPWLRRISGVPGDDPDQSQGRTADLDHGSPSANRARAHRFVALRAVRHRVSPPQNARMVLISSLGDPWPVAGATNVSLTGEQFDALWNGRAGSVPEILQWDGAGEDLILGRLDLREQFVPVVLTRSAGEAPAFLAWTDWPQIPCPRESLRPGIFAGRCCAFMATPGRFSPQ